MSDGGTRHVGLPVVEGYFTSRVEGILNVEGEPAARLIIDPARGALGLQFPVSGPVPDLVDFESLELAEVHAEGMTWHRLTVRVDDNVEEVYALLCAILDRVQVAGEEFGEAVSEALKSLTGIVALRRGLSAERRVGLFGELLVLLVLARSIGPAEAVAAWRGPAAEEHDFGLRGCDLEVKTTLGERREHWISTSTQLAPTGDRPLYLVSLQLTTAALDGGCSLPNLIEQVRNAVSDDLSAFDDALRAAGYRDADADLYHSRWALRTIPAFFEVDERFPAITRSLLDEVVPSPERIRDFRYRVDVDGIAPSNAPIAIDASPWEIRP